MLLLLKRLITRVHNTENGEIKAWLCEKPIYSPVTSGTEAGELPEFEHTGSRPGWANSVKPCGEKLKYKPELGEASSKCFHLFLQPGYIYMVYNCSVFKLFIIQVT